jgi:hypothetical protein
MKISAILLAGLIFSVSVAAQNAKSEKAVTNADLEKYRHERLKNDPDDERERARLGLPSRAEQERELGVRRRELSRIANRIRAQQTQAANYWQARAFELTTEIAAVEAEINYLRPRVGDYFASSPQIYYSGGYSPLYGNCCHGGYQRKTVVSGGQIGGSIVFGNNPRVRINGQFGQTTVQQNVVSSASVIRDIKPVMSQPHVRHGGHFPYTPIFLPVPYVYPTAENLTRAELLARLQLLEQTRAGLYARFAVLVEAAHQAGVKID